MSPPPTCLFPSTLFLRIMLLIYLAVFYSFSLLYIIPPSEYHVVYLLLFSLSITIWRASRLFFLVHISKSLSRVSNLWNYWVICISSSLLSHATWFFQVAVAHLQAQYECSHVCAQLLLLLLPNHTWVPSPTWSKTNLLTLDCGEGKCSAYCRHQARSPGS